jgi:DNA-binding CsgD family transcriptional regulator/PAS domain-containing protein
MGEQQDTQLKRALDLVGKVYEAAADSSLWPEFLEAFASATGNEGTLVWLHDAADTSARMQDLQSSFIRNVRMEPEYLKSYAEHYTHVNVLVQGIEAVAEGSVMCSSAMVPDAEFRRTEYYNDWLRPQGIGYCMGGPVLRRGNSVAVFSTSRLQERGPFPMADLRLLELLMPHLRRACLLHQRLARLRAERSGTLAALDLLPHAVWLLDAQGRLLFANRAGRDLERRRDGLWIGPDGRPVAADPAGHHALQRCIQRSIQAVMGRCVASDGALALPRRQHETPLQVMVYPLAGDALMQGAAAALFVFDPAHGPVADTAALRSLYGLTKAEAELASALAQGMTLQEYGAEHQLSSNTVRTHLKRALAKTGVHRQSQLVALVARLPQRAAF